MEIFFSSLVVHSPEARGQSLAGICTIAYFNKQRFNESTHPAFLPTKCRFETYSEHLLHWHDKGEIKSVRGEDKKYHDHRDMHSSRVPGKIVNAWL